MFKALLAITLMILIVIPSVAAPKKKKLEPPPEKKVEIPEKPPVLPIGCMTRDQFVAFASEYKIGGLFRGSPVASPDSILISILPQDGLMITKIDVEGNFCILFVINEVKINQDVIINLHKRGNSKI